VAALSPPPPQPDDHLLPALYASLDGDNWTRNDGWLDPDVHWCDWYGVTCGEEFWPGYFDFDQLDLSDNNLRGQIGDLVDVRTGQTLPEVFLDLSGNHIDGPLTGLPINTLVVNLSGNRFSGPLPTTPFIPVVPGGGPLQFPIQYLDLSGNLFSGTIPVSWAGDMQLDYLDLSDNQLEGEILNAVRSMRSVAWQGWVFPDTGLWLADNAFSGVIDPAWFDDLDLAGLNLCWTDLEINDPELDAWIAERHWGGSHHPCLDRERLPLDTTVSGTWYDVHRPGEGFSLMLLEDGTPLVFWFSHISNNRQLWLFNSGQNRTTTTEIAPLLRTRGEFDQGFGTIEHPLLSAGGLRLDRVGSDRIHAEFRVAYTGYDLPSEIQITWPPMPDTGFRSDHYQLTRLAGSTCNNQHAMQWTSGAWYNPERSGEGFVVEVNEDGRGIVYWFTYTPEGTNDDIYLARSGDWQAWMTGDGHFEGNSLVIENLLQARDTADAMPADASGIENQHWGSLRLDFHDDLSGQISFDSVLEDFGSGSYPVERLAKPMLADCE
jgi:hypothetical protein